MTKALLVFDELDSKLGFFFQNCMDNLDDFFNISDLKPDILKSGQLNSFSVQLKTDSLDKFVFAAYSHGGKNCLVNSNIPYISTTVNIKCFNNTFFYTFSCSSGIELGSHLIQDGCLCYIGYNKVISIWSTHLVPFVECANYGLIQFFKGNDTESVFLQMVEKYNLEIDAIYKQDFMISSILMENRDALVMHGKNINITSL
jgi:hypothetical protein